MLMNERNKAAPVGVLLRRVRVVNAMASTIERRHVLGVSEDIKRQTASHDSNALQGTPWDVRGHQAGSSLDVKDVAHKHQVP